MRHSEKKHQKKMNEKEFLQHMNQEAKFNFVNTKFKLRQHLYKQIFNPKYWVKQKPFFSLASASVIGFLITIQFTDREQHISSQFKNIFSSLGKQVMSMLTSSLFYLLFQKKKMEKQTPSSFMAEPYLY